MGSRTTTYPNLEEHGRSLFRQRTGEVQAGSTTPLRQPLHPFHELGMANRL